MSLSWRMFLRVSSLMLAIWVPNAWVLAAQSDTTADKLMAQGLTAFQHGQFEQAAVDWQRASALYADEDNIAQQFEALLQLVDAYQALGQPRDALQVLRQAEPLAKQTTDHAVLKGSLGKVYWLAGLTDEAKSYLQESISLAQQTGDARTGAVSHNNLGNLLSGQEQYGPARAHYRESLTLARRSGDQVLVAKILTNTAKAALRDNDHSDAKRSIEAALQQTRALSDSHDKTYGLIALGQLCRTIPTAQARWRVLAGQLFTEAATVAEALDDQSALAYAWGYLGQLYSEEQREQEAIALTRRAVFAAQQAQAPELLYRWQWQLGRLLVSQGDIDQAILAYQQAVTSLQSVRHDLSLSYANRGLSFREAVGEVFFELADLLLQQARKTSDPRQQQRYLVAVRDTVEGLRSAELKDYYQDECVVALQSRITELDRPPRHAAVLYPILLPERTELLLSLADGIKQFSVSDGNESRPVNRETLTETVRDFRHYLEKRTTREYLTYAQRLYTWLITPIEATLRNHQIDTLIIVPDGPLRTIPLAALHDGRTFLINQYAVATIPGLTLTDLQPVQRQDTRLLLNGLTKSVQGFPALEYVSSELDNIHQAYGGTVLRDERFLLTNVRRELTSTPYSIVHIASHGQFASDVDNTFLLTFDDKLTMNRLERFMSVSRYRSQPVELLTLSACETAAGDDRAALGLAGIAVKAGARSALATLWFINDQSTSLLVTEFYKQLQDASLSKAKALQQAQLKLLDDRRYRHPGYWSPFLLIGNWM